MNEAYETNLDKFLEQTIDDFSKNKQTKKVYRQIFDLFYCKLYITKDLNEYGHTQIHSSEFKEISRKKYKDILIHMKKKGILWTSSNIGDNHLGQVSPGGKHIIRAYNFQRQFRDKFITDLQNYTPEKVTSTNQKSVLQKSVLQKSVLQKSVLQKSVLQKKCTPDTEKSVPFADSKQNNNSILIPISNPPLYSSILFYSKGSTLFLTEKGNYDIVNAYKMITLDEQLIEYAAGDDDYIQFVNKWNNHAPVKQVRNRIYSWFHSLKKRQRNWLMINGSHLIQAFDVHACNFCILGKLLQTTQVDKQELHEYQRIMKFEYIYAEIAKYAGIQFTKLVKDCIKKSCQHWLNIRKQHLSKGKNKDKYFDYVDSYFKNNFPSIYDVIVNWHEEEYSNGAGKTKKSKMLWDDYQKVQLEIITGKICLYLYKTYGVLPVTVHDAVYLSKADMEKITENIDDIFWKIIDYQYLDYNNTKNNAIDSNNVNLENAAEIIDQLPKTITGEVDIQELMKILTQENT